MRHLSATPRTTPVGVRDFPPEAAAAFYALERELTEAFSAAKYQRVITPAFELAHVLERGLGPDAAPVLRFVDPQNGEILALRSDITPQIARLVCGPMGDAALPLRLSYFGRVFRLRTHSEFQRREVAQAGVELIGANGAAVDAELLALCDRALGLAGPGDHVFSIGHVGIVTAALAACGIENARDAELIALLRKKDRQAVELAARERGATPEAAANLASLTTLMGSPEDVLERARLQVRAIDGAEPGLDRLSSVLDALSELPNPPRCLVDLGEMAGFGYYTGLVFHAYLPGVGQAVASGGRYDRLLAAYGRELPAAGFAIDEEGLTEVAKRHRACSEQETPAHGRQEDE